MMNFHHDSQIGINLNPNINLPSNFPIQNIQNTLNNYNSNSISSALQLSNIQMPDQLNTMNNYASTAMHIGNQANSMMSNIQNLNLSNLNMANNPMASAMNNSAGGGMAMDPVTGIANAVTSGFNFLSGLTGPSEGDKRQTIRTQHQEQRQTIETQGRVQKEVITKQHQEQRQTMTHGFNLKNKIMDKEQKHRKEFVDHTTKRKKEITEHQSDLMIKHKRMAQRHNLELADRNEYNTKLHIRGQRRNNLYSHENRMVEIHAQNHLLKNQKAGDIIDQKQLMLYQQKVTQEQSNQRFKQQALANLMMNQSNKEKFEYSDTIMKQNFLQKRNYDNLKTKNQAILKSIDHSNSISKIKIQEEEKRQTAQTLNELKAQAMNQKYLMGKELQQISFQNDIHKAKLSHASNKELQQMQIEAKSHEINSQFELEKIKQNNKLQYSQMETQMIKDEYEEKSKLEMLRTSKIENIENSKFRRELYFKNLDAIKNNIPDYSSEIFVPRPQIIQQIEHYFDLNNKQYLHPNKTLSLYGWAGSGKSFIAWQYATTHFDNPYAKVWWIECDSQDTIFDSIRDISLQEGMEDPYQKNIKTIIGYSRLKTSQAKKRCLIVWDNLEDPNLYYNIRNKYRFYPAMGVDHIITSRNYLVPNNMTINKMTLEQAYRLTTSIYSPMKNNQTESKFNSVQTANLQWKRGIDNNRVTDSDQAESLKHLLENKFHNNPLKISQTIQYLRGSSTPYDEYLGLSRHQKQQLSEYESPLYSYSRNLTCKESTLLKVKELTQSYPFTLCLMKVLSVIDFKNIPKDLFKDITHKVYQYRNAVMKLKELGLIQSKHGMLEMNPLSQEYIYDGMTPPEKLKNFELSLNHLSHQSRNSNIYINHINVYWSKLNREYMQKAQNYKKEYLTLIYKSTPMIMQAVAYLKNNTHNHKLISQQRIKLAYQMLALLIKNLESSANDEMDLEDIFKVEIYHTYSELLLLLNEKDSALKFIDKSLEQHPSLNQKVKIIITKSQLVSSKEQLFLLEEMLQELSDDTNHSLDKGKLKSELSVDPKDIYTLKFILSKACLHENNLKKAASLAKESLKYFSQINHKSTIAEILYILGMSLIDTNESEAILQLNKSKEIYEELNNFEKTYAVTNILAENHEKNNNIKDAVKAYEQNCELIYRSPYKDKLTQFDSWKKLITNYQAIAEDGHQPLAFIIVEHDKPNFIAPYLKYISYGLSSKLSNLVTSQYRRSAQSKALLSPSIIQLICRYFSVLNLKNNDGLSLLHKAKSSTMVTKLVEYGADVEISNMNGKTPFQYHKTKGSGLELRLKRLNANPWLDESDNITDLDGHNDRITELKASTRNEILISCDRTNTICLWNTSNHSLMKRIKEKRNISSIGIAPNGRFSSLCFNDQKSEILDIGNNYKRYRLKTGKGIHLCEFLNSSTLVTLSNDNVISRYDITSNKYSALGTTSISSPQASYHEDNIYYIGSSSGKLEIIDLRDVSTISKVQVTKNPITHLAGNRLNLLAIADKKGRMYCLDKRKIYNKENLYKIKKHRSNLSGLSFSSRYPNLLISCCYDDELRVANLTDSYQIIEKHIEDEDLITNMSIDRLHNSLIYGYQNGKVKIWDLSWSRIYSK